MNHLLERLGGFAARRHWVVIIAWLVILGGLLAAVKAFGGEYVNNYTVSGSDSAVGLDVLNSTFPQQGGYAGQIVFHAKSGTVSAQQSAVNQAVTNVSKLPNVIKAVSPFASSNSGAVSKDGTIAYASVAWNVNPDSLDAAYLDKLNNAVAPATQGRPAGRVRRRRGADRAAHQRPEVRDHRPVLRAGAAAVHVRLGDRGRDPAAVGDLQRRSPAFRCSGCSRRRSRSRPPRRPSRRCSASASRWTTGCSWWPGTGSSWTAGWTSSTSATQAEGTSGAAIVVAGGTVVVSILGLYVSGVAFVGSLGLAAAIVVVVTMLAALTLVPAFMGLVRGNVRALSARVRARRAGLSAREQAAQTAAATQEQHEHSAFARWGRKVSERPWPWAVASVAVLVVLAIPLFSITLGQPDNGTNPTSESNRRAYDLMSQGFGVGVNGPLTVVVKLPNQSSSDNQLAAEHDAAERSATADVASVTPAAGELGRHHGGVQRDPDHPAAGQGNREPGHQLRDDVLPKSHVTSYVTGTTAGTVDFSERITSRIVVADPRRGGDLVSPADAAFRSVVIATKAAILNLLSIGAAYGVIVAIFQWGWGASLIGLHTTLPIPAYVPMLVFCIVFGLSMDYEVFLLSRVHEAWVATGDPHRSVAIGIGATARVITTAAAIMVVVFASFVLEHRSDGEDARHRHGLRGADRRLAGPDDPGAVGDVAAGRACLVDAALAGADRARTCSWRAAPRRQRRHPNRRRLAERQRRRSVSGSRAGA